MPYAYAIRQMHQDTPGEHPSSTHTHPRLFIYRREVVVLLRVLLLVLVLVRAVGWYDEVVWCDGV